MGPRLVSRGNLNQRCAHVIRELLQWGRGLLAAEIRYYSIKFGCQYSASMGPRLVSRGNRHDHN